ncbi:hypothetical protein Ae201684_010661 [Aphanomyces euteiches]|uniref:Uncharacterized protein n=1 Tax=Aphanomyces euteiches TaxID=100861 RepID=A0A6G0WXK7_9STRA|nr:hypothetical protein Ae201684_010661 [Aphanomyces euteiches]
MGRRYKITSFASSVALDKTTAGRPRNESFNLHGAWAIHRVDNWLELLGIQLAFTTTNLIVFAADFYLTHQGLHGFLAKKPILSSVLSAGTERRKCVLLVSVLNCAHYINVGCPHWITSLPLDTTHSIKIGIQLYVKPRVQVILGYASMVEKKSPSRQRFESIDDKPQPARKHVYVVSGYALIAVWASNVVSGWLSLQPFGLSTQKNVFHPTAAVSFGCNLFRHDRSVCV